MKWTEAQETAIKKDGSDLLVSAGAGCGKTAILTNRILRLMLDNKVDIDRFMIATFTNAAASSMKEKIRKLLYEKLSSEKNEDTKKFIFRQISKLESASISTIHSFCIRLIRKICIFFCLTEISCNYIRIILNFIWSSLCNKGTKVENIDSVRNIHNKIHVVFNHKYR